MNSTDRYDGASLSAARGDRAMCMRSWFEITRDSEKWVKSALGDFLRRPMEWLISAELNKNPRPKGRGIGILETAEGTPQAAGNLPAMIAEVLNHDD